MAPYAPAVPAGMTGSDAWRVIRSNSWLIILMIFVGAAAGYGINWWLLRNDPKFTADGKLLVRAPTVVTATDPFGTEQLDPAALGVKVRTYESGLMHNSALIDRVLRNPDSEVRNSVWFKSFPNVDQAKQELTDRLDVSALPDTPIIDVSMTDSDAKSCQVIVQSIADEFIKEQEERDRNREYDRHSELEAEAVGEQGNIKLIEGDIAELEAELNSAGVTGVGNTLNIKNMQLGSLFTKLMDLQSQGESLEQQYATLASQINADQDPPIVAARITADPEVQKYQPMVASYELNLESLEGGTDSSPGEDNPQTTQLKNLLRLAQQKLADAQSQARVQARMEVLEEAKQKLTDNKNQIDLLQKDISSVQGDMAQLTDKETQLNQKLSDKGDYETKLKDINNEIDQINNTDSKADFAGIEWEERPELPNIPSFPKLQMIMPFSIAVGLALALGIAFLREWMDTSIRSPRDINRVGSMNLLGMVPHEDDDPQSAGARLPVVIFEAPHSMMAEQLRQVRTRLQHGSSLDTTRSILITSPSPGDGKSTMACNLAAGLALNGRRILLVDANFRRPELHRIFNLQNNQGFADVLNSLDLFEHSVQETQVPNLYVLPSGPKPSNATELIESQLMVDFIERVLEEFDHVIFDSGPLLFVSETVALAPRVDGVVTVVRARANTRGVLTRTRDTLRQIKSEHLGVILNAVRAQGGGYYGRNIRTYYEYQNGDGDRAA
jgi:capsular exopolysaccharide synthesis family protein